MLRFSIDRRKRSIRSISVRRLMGMELHPVCGLYDPAIARGRRAAYLPTSASVTGCQTPRGRTAEAALYPARSYVRGWLMSWAVTNADVEPKGNAIIITKQASGSAKIDPLMAAFNAIALIFTGDSVTGAANWQPAGWWPAP